MYLSKLLQSFFPNDEKILFNFLTRKWESLPDLPAERLFHGCDYITMNNKPYLVVYGGQNAVGTALSSISFLDLNNRLAGWNNFPGIQLNIPAENINGGIVKQVINGRIKI